MKNGNNFIVFLHYLKLLINPLCVQGEPLSVAYLNRARGLEDATILTDIPLAQLEDALTNIVFDKGQRYFDE